ncbi:MAG: hypothetical protein KIT11_05290 [Fimbriimonadaceae bacterium]|nr:hypothetical protein [Fimbriimonadaceae bacterium]QYK56694.1 MAG: hypothetical protein KF733_04230 [Fimbriimonadaceae bacterium]
MADKRLRVVGVPPGGAGLRATLPKLVRPGTVVTALEDGLLRPARACLGEIDDVDFVPMGDLVGRVLTICGSTLKRMPTRGQTLAMVSLAAESLEDSSPFSACAKFRGTLRLVEERLGELRDRGLEAEELRTIAERAPQYLAEKLDDLAAIAELVRDTMDASNREFASDRAARCRGLKMGECTVFSRLVVLAGNEERPVYEDWMRWCADEGIHVDVLVEHVSGRPDLFKYGRRLAERLAPPLVPMVPSDPWYAALYTDKVATNAPKVEVMTSGDPLSECEWAVRTALRAIEEGTPIESIAFHARDLESYGPLLALAAGRHGLRLSLSRAVALMGSGFARLIAGLLSALATNDPRTVGRLGRFGYLDLTRDERRRLTDACANAVREAVRPWDSLSEWADEAGERFAWLRATLAWRQEAQGDARLSVWLDRLRDLVGSTSIAEAVCREDAPDDRDIRAQTLLQRAIADYAYGYDQAGLPELNLARFCRLANDLWQDETIHLPAVPGGVTVVSDAARLPAADLVVALGLLEGTMPRRRSEDTVLDDADREEIARLSGIALPSSIETSENERDEFVRLCAAAGQRLVLSYPLAQEERESIPAFAIKEVERAAGGADYSNHPLTEWAPAMVESRSEADHRLRAALEMPADKVEPPKLEDADALKHVRPNLAAGITPEEIGLVLTCPFHAAWRHRLEVFEPTPRRGLSLLRHLPRKAKLATAPDAESAISALEAEADELFDRLWPHLEPWELAVLRSGSERLIQDWVAREFRARTIWPRVPGSVKADVAIENEERLRTTFKSATMSVTFKADVTFLAEVKGGLVLGFVEPGNPDLDEKGSTRDLATYGVYFLLLPGIDWCGLEIDSMSGQRKLWTSGESAQTLVGDIAKGLARAPAKTDHEDDFLKAAKDYMKNGLKLLRHTVAEPRPGDHCKACPYGEICRFSREFSEEPFGDQPGEEGSD